MPQAEYIIDIATNMPDAERTSAQLQQITASLTGVGAESQHYEQAVVQLANALKQAQAAAGVSKDALAAASAEYHLLEQAALQTSKAEEKAAKTGVVPPDVAAAAAQASAAVNAYATRLRSLEAESETAIAEQKKLATALANAKQLHGQAASATDEHTISTRALSRGLSELGGPLGQLGRDVLTPIRGFQALSQELGSSNALMAVAAIGTVALVAAIVAAAAALAYAVVKVAAWAVGLADATRSADLHEQALEKLNARYGAVSDELDGLVRGTNLTRTQVDTLTESLVSAHVSVANMPAALKAAALAESALGQGGATEFIDRIKAGTLTVQAFAKQSQDSFGGIVAQQMLSLDGQTKTFHENIAALFGGLDIDPALKGLQKLVALFDENTAAGSAMKFLFSAVFQPLINQAENAATVVEAFVLGFLIGLTKLYITLKPAIRAVEDFFGFKDASLTNTLTFVTKAAEYLAPVIALMAAAFAAVAVAVGASIGVFVALQVAVYAVVAAVIYAAGVVIGVFVRAWQSVIGFFSGLSLSTIGGDLIHGLVNGLVGAGPAVLHAIAGVVTGAIAGAKALLGIHSPSTVFAGIGDNTIAGYAQGVQAAAPDAHEAVAAAMAPPSRGALGDQDALSGNTRGGSTTNTTSTTNKSSAAGAVSGNTFIFQGVPGAEEAIDMLRQRMTEILEAAAGTGGGAAAAT